jgi:hypothetical protein
MSKLAIALFVLLFSASVFAGTSAVTATITDSDSQTWNNGTYLITFVAGSGHSPSEYTVNGTPFTQTLNGTLSNAGVLTVTLTDLSTISPSGGSWRFQLCPNASVPCSSIVTTAVVGAAPNLSAVLSAGVVAPRFATSAIAYGYLDGEVTPTPQPGGSYFNVTNSVTRVWTGSAWINGGGISMGSHVTNAANFGLVQDYFISNASVTSGQSIVTCPSNNCNFLTTAAVGNIMQGGNLASGQILNTGTITSVDSNSQVHVSTTASATASGNMEFAWGVDNTTALSNAWTASRQACSFLYIPQGIYFTTTAQFILAAGVLCTNPNGYFANGVFGDVGWANTVIIPTYNFNFATCNVGNNCFFGIVNGSYDYIAIEGMYGGSTAATVNLLNNNGGYFYRIRLNDWCSSCSNSIGMVFTGINPITTEGSSVNSGGLAQCASTATRAINILNPCFATTGGSGTSATAARGMYVLSGQMQSFSNGYGGGVEAVRVDAGAILEEDNDNNVPSGGFGNMITNGTHIIHNSLWNATSVIHSGGTMIVDNTSWTGVGSFMNVNAGGTLVDKCGNTPGTTPTNSGTYVACPQTTTVVTAAKLVLSGTWGNTAAWSSLSGFNGFTGTITASGTGQGASPTITYTFPAAYLFAPQTCNASIVKSNDAGVTITNNYLATSSLTGTGAVFTYNGTPVAGDTYTVAGSCI